MNSSTTHHTCRQCRQLLWPLLLLLTLWRCRDEDCLYEATQRAVDGRVTSIAFPIAAVQGRCGAGSGRKTATAASGYGSKKRKGGEQGAPLTSLPLNVYSNNKGQG